jgi:predicted branched-subunit amino acid permease
MEMYGVCQVLSVLLTIVSAGLTHISVRKTHGMQRTMVFCMALLLFGGAVSLSAIPGGTWSGAYTLLSVYFIACLLTPWMDLLWKSYRAA